MPFFFGSSNDRRDATRGLIAPETDHENFKIHKAGRFGNRFFQICVALGAWAFLGKQSPQLTSQTGMGPWISWGWFVAVLSPVVSSFLIAIYFFPWFKKSWTSRKTLVTEFLFDTSAFVLWTLTFAGLLATTTSTCYNVPQDGCSNFSWLMAWMGMSTIFWFAAICFDVLSYAKGVHGWGDRLSEGEADSILRTLARKINR